MLLAAPVRWRRPVGRAPPAWPRSWRERRAAACPTRAERSWRPAGPGAAQLAHQSGRRRARSSRITATALPARGTRHPAPARTVAGPGAGARPTTRVSASYRGARLTPSAATDYATVSIATVATTRLRSARRQTLYRVLTRPASESPSRSRK